jgi:hypothetical protein
MRLVGLARREKSADVPLVTDVSAYHEVAARVSEALNRHGFDLVRAEPGWWAKAPTRILGFFGGSALAGFVPERLEHFEAHGLSVSKGRGPRLTFAQGLIGETAVHCRGLETFAPAAQEIESQLRRLWTTFDAAPRTHAGSPIPLARVDALARDLTRLEVDYDEWQVLYRQLRESARRRGAQAYRARFTAPRTIGRAQSCRGAPGSPR